MYTEWRALAPLPLRPTSYVFGICFLAGFFTALKRLNHTRTMLSTHTLVHKSAEKEGIMSNQITSTALSQGVLFQREGGYIPRIAAVHDSADELERLNAATQLLDDPQEQCDAYRDTVLPAMDVLRTAVDGMEKVCGADYWPVPTYDDILFYV